jgi:hypothetical protein
MKFRNLKLIDRIIIIGTLGGAIFLIAFWWSTKRDDRDYYLPEDFSGWISVVHSVPGAPPLQVKDGALQVPIPPSGYLETLTPLEQGWSRNRFFRKSEEGWKQIPGKTEVNGEPAIFIHRHEFYHYSHYPLLDTLPVGTDTTLWDGARLVKYAEDDRMYNPGFKTVEFFYISKEPKPLTFNPPPHPNDVSDRPYRDAYN